MALAVEFPVCSSLRLDQMGHVQLCILIPGTHSLIVDQRIGAGVCHCHIRVLFNGFFHAIGILPGGLGPQLP